MKKTALLILPALMAILLTGCQSAADPTTQDSTDQAATQQEVVVDKGLPFSNGPTEGPETVKGPDAPPPGSSAMPAQAVTTDENIRITLPRKTE